MADLERLKTHLTDTLTILGRDSVVVGLSGGIDSAVTVALAVEAIGSSHVSAVAMPEKDSSPASSLIAAEICSQLGVDLVVDDLTSTLDSLGVYAKRDAAIRSIFPQYSPAEDSFSMRIVQHIREENFPAVYEAVMRRRASETLTKRVRLDQYMSIFAASNSKQRLRTLKLYEYAELHGCAVLGTSNWDETYLGFFVKGGDGAWDVCMLNDCTKTEVWELADRLGLPASVTSRMATTDTFPDGGGSQTDMFYTLPFEQLDVLLDHMRGRISRAQCLNALNLDVRTLEIVMSNLKRRHRSTEWNRAPGIGYPSVLSGE